MSSRTNTQRVISHLSGFVSAGAASISLSGLMFDSDQQTLTDAVRQARLEPDPPPSEVLATLLEQNTELLEAMDKAAARFDYILGKMSELSSMTPTDRLSYDGYVADCRNEARAIIAKCEAQNA